MNKETKDIIDLMITDQKVRRSIVRGSHIMFFSVYFGHYIEFDFADFHREMFTLSENLAIQMLVVVASREVGKSTILNTSLALWSILGMPQSKFVVLVGETQAKAKQHFLNLKKELEENPILKKDLGPFKEESNEWGSSIELSYYGAKIVFASKEQSLRGIRYKQHRPDLIIVDDIESEESVKTLDGRNKVYNWLVRDVIPAGSRTTRLVVLGTLLHEDSIMMRLKNEIVEGQRSGEYREYPLLDEHGAPLWTAKYPDTRSIEEHRLKIGNDKAWFQEFLLKIVSDADRVVHPEWVHYYDELPDKTPTNNYRGPVVGIDLAISQADRADYTAMVSACVYGYGKDMRIYVLPNPVNERIGFPGALERAKFLSSTLSHNGEKVKMYIENNQYQDAFPQMLKHLGYVATGVRSIREKRVRLTLINPVIKSGQVLFPKEGADTLIKQLIGFGVENHDDLADALSLLVGEVVKNNPAQSFSDSLRFTARILEESLEGEVSMLDKVF